MADITITDQTFNELVLQSKEPVLIDFWAEWCPPCKMISPIIEGLAKEYDGKVVIGKMNADENQEVVNRYTIMSLPTVMIFKNGEPIQTLIGAKSKQTYIAEINKVLA